MRLRLRREVPCRTASPTVGPDGILFGYVSSNFLCFQRFSLIESDQGFEEVV